MSERTWITREEIAAICDAEADRIEARVRSDQYTLLGELVALPRIQLRRTQAAGLRYIDKMPYLGVRGARQ